MLVVGHKTHELLALSLRGPQVLRFAGEVIGDDGVGGVEDRLGGPVVLVEHDDRGIGEGPLELQDVPYVGAPPAVDRLVGVAHHGDVVVGARQLDHELVLRPVGVLVLVDQNVRKAVLVRGEHVRVLPEQPHGEPQ